MDWCCYRNRAHLTIGLVSFILVISSILDGLKAFKAKSWSGVVAYSVVPFALLVAGTIFAVVSLD